ncbi:LytTR family transcriptional regulator [Amylibacter kogurei]|uniref:LytTR family transcriptional regulator n=1 Tax=Paramylibacter kogurei TaxID=1889778 RepID=A0A2G5K980_9RHOB|nr:DUF4159 domain-containing protein [Amylibacter kogurei]PIB26077.1 LytTR family transcriptional regulator [Amylibacter kogurei]
MTFGAIAFLSPWLLIAGLALPILIWLLRAIPPAPIRQRFPGITLLLGLRDKDTTPDRTPWWLLLLRALAIGAAILAFAEPVLNPSDRVAGRGPLLIGMDASWASAQSWNLRKEKLENLLNEAEQDNRPVMVVKWTDTPTSDFENGFSAASNWTDRLQSFHPNAWEPEYAQWMDAIPNLDANQIIWFSDGLERENRAAFLDQLADLADVSIVQSETNVLALSPITVQDGALNTTITRIHTDAIDDVRLSAIGPDPTGITRKLGSVDVTFDAGNAQSTGVVELPIELRNRVTQVSIDDVNSAGSVVLGDDSLRRRKVALFGNDRASEASALLSELHYLRNALQPTTEVIETELSEALVVNPEVIVFADIGELNELETQEIQTWIEQGGTLLRFAGPNLISSGIGQSENHPLLPVRLRSGGRSVGGAMSWGEPRKLQEFSKESPFFGLKIPDDVDVNSQVVAQPDPDLAARVIASLDDGTPLVTSQNIGQGRVVLFHVTASTKWSNLPLSGLFVQMLERLAITAKTSAVDSQDVAGTIWTPTHILDAYGVLRETQSASGVSGELLAAGALGSELQPGIYTNADRAIALNVIDGERHIRAANWAIGTTLLSLSPSSERALKAEFLQFAFVLLLIDVFATLVLSGRLRGARGGQIALFALLCLIGINSKSFAQTDEEGALFAANNTVLAYVITGDARVDEVSHSGLDGLSAELYLRTNIEPVPPVGVVLGDDDLSLYPFLYWPITDKHQSLSIDAVASLNQYLRNGGFIMFDTRDGNQSGAIGRNTPNGRKLQQIARRLDIPRLEPIPSDHVLTRAFYLLQVFPGRYIGPNVWVEAAPENAEQIEGIPFRNLNDGVTPVLIGANDWAASWAITETGRFKYPVGRGANGERQREFAIRFGVNVLMYVMTGNYKSDQVHVPALLDRLGQ